MTKRIVVDTGPLVALFDHSDADHAKARDFFFRLQFEGLVTTAVVTEVTHLLGFEIKTVIDFLSWLNREALRIEDVAGDMERIIELMTKYSDVPMDFADATIVAICERLKIHDIATLDSDFQIYRLYGKQRFHNHFPS